MVGDLATEPWIVGDPGTQPQEAGDPGVEPYMTAPGMMQTWGRVTDGDGGGSWGRVSEEDNSRFHIFMYLGS